MNNNINTVNNYGVTLKGAPKQKPGRKMGSGNPNATKTIYLVNGKVFSQRGKPSFEVLKARLQVEIPKMETYDANKHGLGTRNKMDDLRVADFESRQAAKIITVTPAPAGPSIAETSVEVAVTQETETVAV